VDDDAFTAHVADRLGALPCVKAVTLGGSRAEGTHRPDSDWDFSIYYQRDLPRRATGSARVTLGHTVLAVPVPALEEVVRERTAFYDASFLSADPGFVHAHITLLAPWADQPTAAELAQVAHIARAAGPFDVKLAQVGEFPDGVLYLRP
jgi:hypothetical protein